MFQKNNDYIEEATYRNMAKTTPQIYCDPTSPDYNLYRQFCHNPSIIPTRWPELEHVYRDITSK